MPDQPTRATVAFAALAGVCLIVLVAVATTVQVGVILLSLYAVGGALARIVLPASAAFAVRRRAVDVSVLAVLAAVLMYLGLTTPLG